MFNFKDVLCGNCRKINSFAIKLGIKVHAVEFGANYLATNTVDVSSSPWLESGKLHSCLHAEVFSARGQI